MPKFIFLKVLVVSITIGIVAKIAKVKIDIKIKIHTIVKIKVKRIDIKIDMISCGLSAEAPFKIQL